jgi:hypothetical protein
MRCTDDLASLDLIALQSGNLPVEHRFRLARHINRCKQCTIGLLLMLEAAEESDNQVACETRAVGVLADVNQARASTWLIAMFARN